MSVTEIILLIVAIALLVLSCVMIDKDKEDTKEQEKEDKITLTKEEREAISAQLDEMVKEAVANHLIETDDKLGQITNEKIIAISDFSTQLLEKMELNQKEVVFLYDTLCQKQEEIKTTFTKMETIRRENKEFLEKLANLMASKGRVKVEKKNEKSMRIEPNEEPLKDMENRQVKNQAQFLIHDAKENSDKNPEEESAVQPVDESAEPEDKSRKEEILKLYNKKVSIKDISKQLDIGQGEVKLIIDLYGKKN